MPSFFSSSFAKGKKTSPEAAAIKQATLIVDRAKAGNSAGVISDPTVYDKAIQILDNFSYDTGVLTKQAQLKAEKNSLMDRLNDQGIFSQKMKSDMEDAMYQIGKNNASSPQAIITKTAALYDLYSRRLNDEISQRIDNAQSFDALIPLKKEIEEKGQNFSALSRQATAAAQGNPNDKSIDPTQFGYLVKTNPDTGKIISFALTPIDSGQTKGYYETDSTYGQIPVYVNAFRDPKDNNNLTAKLGDATFKGEMDTTNPDDKTTGLNKTVLKLSNPADESDNSKFTTMQKIRNAFRVGHWQENFNKELGAYDLTGKIKPDTFTSSVNLPLNSIAKDSTGNYYFLNNEGKLFQGSADTVAQYTGKSKSDIDNDAYFLTKKDVTNLKNEQDPNNLSNSLLPSLQTPNQSTTPAPSYGPQKPTEKSPQSNAGDNAPVAAGVPAGPTSNPYAIKTPAGKEKQADVTQQINSGQFGPKFAGGPGGSGSAVA